MSLLEKRAYPIMIKCWSNFKNGYDYSVKYQWATSLESAIKIATGYCDYHRRKSNAADDNFIVVQKPAFFAVTFTFNKCEQHIDVREVYGIFAVLKSTIFVKDHLVDTDDQSIRKYHLEFYGEDFLKDKLKTILILSQKCEEIIDYSIRCEKIDPEDWSYKHGSINSLTERY